MTSEPSKPSLPGGARILLVLTAVGFVSLGLPDGMLGVAWPSMRSEFGLAIDRIGGVLVTFMAGYLLSSVGSGTVLSRMGLGMLLASSALVTAVSLAAYAMAPGWWVVVAAGFLAGLGAGAVDAGLNAYVALNHRPATMTWLHAAYGLGAAGSPVLLGELLARGASWRTGYIWVAGVEIVLAAGFLATRALWPGPASGGASMLPRGATLVEVLGERRVWLGILVFFLYTGLEWSFGTWCYTWLVSRKEFGPEAAGAWTGAFWGAVAGGRVLVGVLGTSVSPARVVGLSAVVLLAGSALMLADIGTVAALAGLLLTGLACAPMFPMLMAMTPERVGAKRATQVVGVQIAAAILGQSLLPAVIGVAANAAGVRVIPWLWLALAVVYAGCLPAVLRAGPGAGRRDSV